MLECLPRGAPAPPGIAMVSPPEVPRNAQRAQCKGRAREGHPISAAKGHYRGRGSVGSGKAKAALSDDESVQRGQQYKHYRGRSPCVQMYGAPATSAGTPRRLRAQEPRPGPLYSDTTATD